MTAEDVIKGLELIENNLTEFDELFDKSRNGGFGEWVDVHEVLTTAIELLKEAER
jgi:hypothetical protein